MSAYKEFLAANDNAIDAFKDGTAAKVEGFLKAQAAIGEKVEVEQWKAFEASKRGLVGELNELALSILRKVPKIQNEDTLGHEVQTAVVTEIGKAKAKLIGADKEDSTFGTHTGFLAALATLHKDKKDRPDSFPAELDDQRLAALHAHHVFVVKNSYASMISIVVNITTLLTTNKELIKQPKRSFNTMM